MRASGSVAVVGILIGAVLLGGCTSSGGASGGSMAVNSAPGVAAASAARGPSEQSGTTAKTAALVDPRALIRTADMQVAVKSGAVNAQANRADEIATAVGGSVFSDDRTTGKSASARLTLKVPPETLSDVLTRLSALGSERSRTLSTQDVTQQVADVDSRVQSARDSIARLRTLYGHATKVSDVIAIESELATRESDLESLEAQQRTLNAQTSMATVNLDLVTAPPPVAPKHNSGGEHGILGALVTGWHGFTAAAAWVARAVATALPFLVVLALLSLAIGYTWRRRPATPAPPPDPS